ncbi:glycoside hydrolase family 17 protein [Phycomyces blakesleeanus]|uniref:glucan endo-1,3-beta-D-glucosidase n=1 Tax=Phycomyces blakesleeanus TaxID=4837 RepID=A0ABR3AHJ4_PHYBL
MKGICLILASLLLATLAKAEYFYGLNYGINQDSCPTLEDVKKDLTALKPYTNRIRIFSLSVCNQAELALQATQELGMQLYLGMWVDRPDTFDNEMKALDNIASKYGFSNVDAIIVGSEVLYRNDTDSASLANYIKKVKDTIGPKGVKVTTADVYYELPPDVVQELDFVMMNAFPYWEGVSVQDGASTLMNHYDHVVTIAQGKPVKISETGWPSAGDNFGDAVPSPENQKTYLAAVLCEAKKRNIDILWFSAKDEPYRSGVEAHWGILNANNTLKSNIPLSTLQNPC